ncbi:MAG: aspartate/tyrosine/aromatic aminotransferase [Gemmatimonadetes bacterium]|nr:aspartate/tyrosine/aromatic aminotransferase [Gemmatimonadota bacterium]
MSSLVHPLRRPTSRKADRFTESVIREMSREAAKYGAVNLGQGFPDFPAPEEVKEAARRAVTADINQYAVTWGSKDLRDAIADKAGWYLGLDVDPEAEITVTCGSTEAMIATMIAIVDPGDEVVVFEPFYENYAPDAVLADAIPRYVPLRGPDWSFDRDELRAAFNERTRAIVICNPNNPTGKVYTPDELAFIAELCVEHDVFCLSDEIYEHILYPRSDREVRHVSIASLPGMRERTVLINSMSKTYAVTGWRVGWAIAPAETTLAIRKVHDFLTVGAAAPLQAAGAHALRMPREYYDGLGESYGRRRDKLLGVLAETGFTFTPPDGAYYVMAGIDAFAHLGYANDVDFTRFLVRDIGVACVPASSFYCDDHRAELAGDRQVRFCFCKTDATLDAAAERFQKLAAMR